MTHLYKAYVNESGLKTDGLGWFVQFGTPRTVDAKPMVDLGHAIVSAEGWHAERHDAVNEAAGRIEQLAHRLLDQAAKLRMEAATEAAKKAVVTT